MKYINDNKKFKYFNSYENGSCFKGEKSNKRELED